MTVGGTGPYGGLSESTAAKGGQGRCAGQPIGGRL